MASDQFGFRMTAPEQGLAFAVMWFACAVAKRDDEERMMIDYMRDLLPQVRRDQHDIIGDLAGAAEALIFNADHTGEDGLEHRSWSLLKASRASEHFAYWRVLRVMQVTDQPTENQQEFSDARAVRCA